MRFLYAYPTWESQLQMFFWKTLNHYLTKYCLCPHPFFPPCSTQTYVRTSLVAQLVKNLPTVQETQVQSLGREDPLEKGMATHSSILAWRTPRTEKPGGLQSMGSQGVGHN